MSTFIFPYTHYLNPDLIAQLPSVPGVYIFRGEAALPLYIGKSIDIRARVLSHIRGEEKSRLIAQARSLDYIETAGDIGAQLLESQLIKEHKPLYNIRLRRVKKLYSIRLVQKATYLAPQIVSSQEVIVGRTDSFMDCFAQPVQYEASWKNWPKLIICVMAGWDWRRSLIADVSGCRSRNAWVPVWA